jgi:hypothetical protein
MGPWWCAGPAIFKRWCRRSRCFASQSGSPLVHNCPPNLRSVGTPPRRHLHLIKCILYKNIKLSKCNLRSMNWAYLPPCIVLGWAGGFACPTFGLSHVAEPSRPCFARHRTRKSYPTQVSDKWTWHCHSLPPCIPAKLCRNPAYKSVVNTSAKSN